MRPIIGTFFGGKKSVLPSPLPRPCFTYTFVNGSGATKGAGGIRCDGTTYIQLLALGQSAVVCLFEGTQTSSPSGLTITQGAGC